MRTFSLISVGRAGYVSLSKNLKLVPTDMSVSAPMRKPSSNPCLTQRWTSQTPSTFLSAARTSPRLSARLNSSNTALSAGVRFPSRRRAICSICSRNGCSRNGMRTFLQQADLAEDLAHARARLFLHRYERQAQLLFDHAHQRERGLHWTRTRLDEVS